MNTDTASVVARDDHATPLDIRTPTHHLARAFYLLLDAIYEPPEVQRLMLDNARKCCRLAEAALGQMAPR